MCMQKQTSWCRGMLVGAHLFQVTSHIHMCFRCLLPEGLDVTVLCAVERWPVLPSYSKPPLCILPLLQCRSRCILCAKGLLTVDSCCRLLLMNFPAYVSAAQCSQR